MNYHWSNVHQGNTEHTDGKNKCGNMSKTL